MSGKNKMEEILDNFLLEFGALALIIFGSILGLGTLIMIGAPEIVTLTFILALVWMFV